MRLSRSYVLPADPLLERDTTKPVNILLVAFSYLIRRLTVSNDHSDEFDRCAHRARSFARVTAWCATNHYRRTSMPSSHTSAAQSYAPTSTIPSTEGRRWRSAPLFEFS